MCWKHWLCEAVHESASRVLANPQEVSMKRRALFAVFLGCCLTLHAQEWCFSSLNNCPVTPATVFQPNQAAPGPTLPLIFPLHHPVFPLKALPSTEPFFLYAGPNAALSSSGLRSLTLHISDPANGISSVEGGKSLGIHGSPGFSVMGPRFPSGH
jgi:hypothetical protein